MSSKRWIQDRTGIDAGIWWYRDPSDVWGVRGPGRGEPYGYRVTCMEDGFFWDACHCGCNNDHPTLADAQWCCDLENKKEREEALKDARGE